jgi:hypothetical protein
MHMTLGEPITQLVRSDWLPVVGPHAFYDPDTTSGRVTSVSSLEYQF